MGAATAKRRHIPRRTPHRRPTPDSDAGAPGPDSGTGVPSSGSGAGVPDPGQPAQAGAMPPCDHRRVHPEASAMPAANTVQPPARPSPRLGLAQARPSPRLDPAPSLIQSPARSSFQRHLQRAILRLSILYHSRVIKYQLISKEKKAFGERNASYRAEFVRIWEFLGYLEDQAILSDHLYQEKRTGPSSKESFFRTSTTSEP